MLGGVPGVLRLFGRCRLPGHELLDPIHQRLDLRLQVGQFIGLNGWPSTTDERQRRGEEERCAKAGPAMVPQ